MVGSSLAGVRAAIHDQKKAKANVGKGLVLFVGLRCWGNCQKMATPEITGKVPELRFAPMP